MLKIEKLSVNIQKTPILRDVSLSLPVGNMVGLIGRNGAGKTTLMRAVMGLMPYVSGSMHFGEVDMAKDILKQYLAVAREEMPAYPGARFEDWKSIWKSSSPYCNDQQYQLLLDSLSIVWPE